METITEKMLNKHGLVIKDIKMFGKEFDLFFANTNLSKEDRLWLMDIIKRLKNNE